MDYKLGIFTLVLVVWLVKSDATSPELDDIMPNFDFNISSGISNSSLYQNDSSFSNVTLENHAAGLGAAGTPVAAAIGITYATVVCGFVIRLLYLVCKSRMEKKKQKIEEIEALKRQEEGERHKKKRSCDLDSFYNNVFEIGREDKTTSDDDDYEDYEPGLQDKTAKNDDDYETGLRDKTAKTAKNNDDYEGYETGLRDKTARSNDDSDTDQDKTASTETIEAQTDRGEPSGQAAHPFIATEIFNPGTLFGDKKKMTIEGKEALGRHLQEKDKWYYDSDFFDNLFPDEDEVVTGGGTDVLPRREVDTPSKHRETERHTPKGAISKGANKVKTARNNDDYVIGLEVKTAKTETTKAQMDRGEPSGQPSGQSEHASIANETFSPTTRFGDKKKKKIEEKEATRKHIQKREDGGKDRLNDSDSVNALFPEEEEVIKGGGIDVQPRKEENTYSKLREADRYSDSFNNLFPNEEGAVKGGGTPAQARKEVNTYSKLREIDRHTPKEAIHKGANNNDYETGLKVNSPRNKDNYKIGREVKTAAKTETTKARTHRGEPSGQPEHASIANEIFGPSTPFRGTGLASRIGDGGSPRTLGRTITKGHPGVNVSQLIEKEYMMSPRP